MNKQVRVGSVGYATSQGLGHLMLDSYRAGLVDRVMVVRHPRNPMQNFYPDAPVLTMRPFSSGHPADVREFLSNVDVVIFWETPFDWDFPYECRSAGVKTVLVPMHEWYPLDPKFQGVFDQVICPSLLDLDWYRKGLFGICKGCFIPFPAWGEWRLRETALHYVHNAGHVGSNMHKGTLEVLKALPLCSTPIDFTLRCQDPNRLAYLLGQSGLAAMTRITHGGVRKKVQINNVALTIDWGDVSREELYRDFDVCVQPEKYNGLSLPLQEAHAAGCLVIASDRFPANTWLPIEPLVGVEGVKPIRVANGYPELECSIIDPKVLAGVMDLYYENDISDLSLAGKTWAEENSWNKLGPAWVKVLEDVCA